MQFDPIQNDPRPVLVVGSTGKTGRRVVAGLRRHGVVVREGARRTSPPFDWERPETWAVALSGVRAAYVTFHPDLAVEGAPAAIAEFTRLAAAKGVEQLVLLSGRGEPEARRCEQIVEDSGLDWTVVRASWFAQNFSEGFLRDLVVAGTVALPTGDVREPFVDVDDIAEVAVKALTGRALNRRVVEVTGPRLMTFAEATAEVAAAAGLEVEFVDVSHADFLASLAAAGVPAAYVQLLDYLFRVVLDGRNASTTDGVESALGRPARDFADYARGAAAHGAWTAEVAR